MSTRRCEGCGRRVHVAGGIGDFWDFGTLKKPDPGGLVLEFGDGSEFFLCTECIERLPEDADQSDVEALAAGDVDSEGEDVGSA
ncbi:DUF7561 family protein [Halocalculus aciditolerans]|uniref:Small CPxCG-related zinc finger protein n=1 Tax=Halocalculus aciditolerans TaxID=1383812 RepID=A0A830F7E3_9EURY|nr:hypothetical protein [Halocalculus aciditolerans]GGL46411.1 hypothetical protein GCM10009039_01000 [Halocalculus aciditolerans]